MSDIKPGDVMIFNKGAKWPVYPRHPEPGTRVIVEHVKGRAWPDTTTEYGIALSEGQVVDFVVDGGDEYFAGFGNEWFTENDQEEPL